MATRNTFSLLTKFSKFSEKKELEDEIPTIYSSDDISKLAAKQLKAELMGNTQLAKKRKEQLEEAREIVKVKGFAKRPKRSNGTAEIDYESGRISKILSKKLLATQDEERYISISIQQHQKISAREKCEYCLDQPRGIKYLVVDIGEHVYLCLPNFKTLAEGHLLIIPKMHVSSFISLDKNEWKEVNDLKNKLRNFFRADDKSLLFLETNINNFHHAIVECIPVPKEDGDMAPFYFKKAIQESETEWAHNIKLIDLTKKSLRHSIPKGLPYFHVEFDPVVHAGFAHVIEDGKKFPRNFGKEVVGGMLDIDYNYLYKNKREDARKQLKDVVNFQKRWNKYIIGIE